MTSGAHLHQLLQPVVPVDDATVEVVQVRGGEAAAVERHERAQVRRDHRYHVHDHPLGLVPLARGGARVADRVDHLEPLQRLLLPVLARLVGDLLAQLLGQAVQPVAVRVPVPLALGVVRHVQLAQEGAHGIRADVGTEVGILLLARLLTQLDVLVLVEDLRDLHVLLPGAHHRVGRVVDHLLQVAQRHPQQVAHLRGERLEEPDVGDRHGELDVPHPLAPHLGQRDLHAALVADHPAVADPLELPAVALPVLDRSEDALAEEPVPLRLEGAVVDGLGLGHLPEAPRTDLIGRGDLHLDEVEVRRPGFTIAGKVDHVWSPLLYEPSNGAVAASSIPAASC
jgi:hypothetical protein